MTKLEISNWIAIYLATGICCVFATIMSVLTVVRELVDERFWKGISGWKPMVLLIPRVWWRWQKRYLLSTPVTLAIVAWFAATLDWGR